VLLFLVFGNPEKQEKQHRNAKTIVITSINQYLCCFFWFFWFPDQKKMGLGIRGTCIQLASRAASQPASHPASQPLSQPESTSPAWIALQ